MTGIIEFTQPAGRTSARGSPSKSGPGSGELRVRHTAIGIKYIDVYHRCGLCAQPLPFIAGVEGAGIVEAVGPAMTNFQSGAHVAYAMLPGSSRMPRRKY